MDITITHCTLGASNAWESTVQQMESPQPEFARLCLVAKAGQSAVVSASRRTGGST